MRGISPLRSAVSAVIYPVKDFFFPPLCFSCNNLLADTESRVCGTCWQQIERVGSDDHTVHVLKERFLAEGSVDEFHSCYYFEEGGVFQKLTHSLKYDSITLFGTELGRHVGRKLMEFWNDGKINGIVPIPLHKLKLRERGYNQSEYVCRGISEILGCTVAADVVKRKKYTVSQTHLSAQERNRNVGDAFEFSDRKGYSITGKTFIVVDDVITTGSTIQSVARVLKNAGASRVIAASAGLAKLK